MQRSMEFSGAGDGGGGSCSTAHINSSNNNHHNLNHHSHNLNQSDSSCSNNSGNGSTGVALFGRGGAASSVTSSRVRPASEMHSESSSSPLLKLARFDQNPNSNHNGSSNNNSNSTNSSSGFLMMPSPGFLENPTSNLNPNLVGLGDLFANGSMAATANSPGMLNAAPALLSATPLASMQPKFYSNSLELGDRYNPYLFSNSASAAHLARAHPAAASLLAGHSRFPFTADQWAEFTQQTYIFKHFTSGVTPPAALLLPIINSVALMSRLGAASLLTAGLTGGFSMGLRGTVDPEPGRCRRTDGKKWRCAREVVPDQKYCERHMHRGRHRARAKQQAQQQQQQQEAQQQQQQLSNPSINANDALNHTSNQASKPTNLVMANSSVTNSSCGLVANHTRLAACRDSQLNFSLGAASSANNEVANRSDTTTAQMLYSDPTGLRRLLETSPHLADLLKSNAVMATSNTTTKLFNNQILQSPVATANHPHHQQQQQQQAGFPFNCVSSAGLSRNSNNNSTDNLALRQFVDISPPNTTAAATMPWLEQLGEDSQKSRRSPSLPLTLSTTAKFGGRDVESTTGLSMAINNSGASKINRGWLPIAWADSSVGGPLAEVLNNANNNSTANFSSSNGDHQHCLNLIEESWDQNPSSAKESHSPSLASPTGVLQIKSTFGSCSDSSSSASSPRSALKLDSAPPALAS